MGARQLNQETLVLASGARVEVVVRAAGTSGRYALSYGRYDQGVDTWPAKTIGTVVVDDAMWTGASHPGVDLSPHLEDLSVVAVPD